MIVTCEKCTTQFKLDDAKVPESGARVRCSRCKHAFFIQPPGLADEEQAEDLAREALEGAQQDVDPRREPEAPLSDDSESSESTESTESDWEFNDGPPTGIDPESPEASSQVERLDFAAARQAVDDLLGESLSDAPSAPPTDEPLPPPERIEVAEPPLDSEPEPAIETPPPPQALEPPARIRQEPPPSPPADLEAAVEVATAEDEPASGLGSPEDWDFFEQDKPPSATPVARIPLVPRWKLQQEEALGAEEEGSGLEAAIDAEIDPGLDREPGTAARALRYSAHVAGWCVTAALLGLGLWGIAMPPAHGSAAPADSQQLGAFRAEEVRGRWVENASGPIYVVSGRLRNRGSSPATVGPLGVRLLSAEGRELDGTAERLSLPLGDEALRERNAEARVSATADGARTLAKLQLMPGVASRFEAVFDALPPQAHLFRLESVPLEGAPIEKAQRVEEEPTREGPAPAP